MKRKEASFARAKIVLERIEEMVGGKEREREMASSLYLFVSPMREREREIDR